MPLGDKLGADQDLEIAPRGGGELGAHRLGAAGEVGGKNERLRAGEQRLDLLAQPLDAGAAGRQRFRVVADRAFVRARLGVAAMMADQRFAEAMIDQPGRAVRALEAVAAGAAERQRRIAAPVQEHQALLAALARRRDLRDELWRQPASARRRVDAQVDRGELWQLPRPVALVAGAASDSAPARRCARVSTEGVAEASTMGALAMRARTTAMSRAL